MDSDSQHWKKILQRSLERKRAAPQAIDRGFVIELMMIVGNQRMSGLLRCGIAARNATFLSV